MIDDYCSLCWHLRSFFFFVVLLFLLEGSNPKVNLVCVHLLIIFAYNWWRPSRCIRPKCVVSNDMKCLVWEWCITLNSVHLEWVSAWPKALLKFIITPAMQIRYVPVNMSGSVRTSSLTQGTHLHANS